MSALQPQPGSPADPSASAFQPDCDDNAAMAGHVHAFVLDGAPDPGLLPRAVELIAKRGMTPLRCLFEVHTPDRARLELVVDGLAPAAADHVLACLRALPMVTRAMLAPGNRS